LLVVFIRHGKAEPASKGKSDEERELTSEGIRSIEHLSKVLPVKPKRIYTSPLKRALQTAEILRKHLGGEIIVTEALSPKKASIESIKDLEIADNDILVGHSPSIEVIISKLIGGGLVKLKAGGAAGIELEKPEEGSGVLVFLLQPFLYESLR